MNRTHTRFAAALRLSWASVLVLSLLWLVHPAQAATSAVIEVDIFDDVKKNDGRCSLREAIIAANTDKKSGGCAAGSGVDTILLPAGTYTLSRSDNGGEDASQTGDLDVDGDLAIVVVDGYGATIDATGIADRALDILSGNVSLSNVTIVGGGSNVDAGGGIYNEASLTLTNVTLSGNNAEDAGGGIYNKGTLALNHVTVSGNNAGTAGGGVYNEAGATVEMRSTILGGNTNGSTPDCSGTLTSLGYNLIADPAGCTFVAAPGDLVGVDPLLGPLADNGGETKTHALSLDSPAIDAGAPTCPPPHTDQRGVSRPQRAACDIGAFEAVNGAPVAATDDDLSTAEDTSLSLAAPGVLSNDSDPDGDVLFVDSYTQPAHGALVLDPDGSFTYTPDADFYGTDAFTYQASDGFELSNVAVVTLTVHPVNDVPLADDQSATTPEDTAVAIVLTGSDVDGDELTYSVETGPSHGSLSGTAPNLTYAPGPNYNGPDSFTFKVNDGTADSAHATVSILVTPVNDPPVADDVAVTGDEDTVIAWTPSVSDPDGDTPTCAIIDQPANGSALVDPGCASGTYTPRHNYDGTDSFSYQASDGELDSTIAIVTITVAPDPYIEVTHTGDSGLGSLRQAIEKANSVPGVDTITFETPGPGPHVIQPASALPTITEAVIIDGTTQPESGTVVLDGSTAGPDVDGLVILGGGSTVLGLEIVYFSGNGILLDGGIGNQIVGNVIAYNNGDGIRILYGSTENLISGNDIHDNGGLGIDLGGDGATPNDPGDGDEGANYVQNYPVLFRAFPDPNGPGLQIDGYLDSQTHTPFEVEFYASETCIPGEGGSQTLLGSTSVQTPLDAHTIYFTDTVESAPEGHFIVATATDPNGNTSEFCPCISVGPGNDSWPRAMRLGLAPVELVAPEPVAQAAALEGEPLYASAQHYVDLPGQSRWYKFPISTTSEVIVTLTGADGGPLPDNYDLAVYKDIAAAFLALQAPQDQQDLLLLGAEFAPGSFSPGSFSPGSFSPGSFSPGSFSPDIYAPGSFSPGSFSPGSFSPGSFSPDIYAPGSFSPGSFSPGSFSPGSFSPGSFSPDVYAPGSFSPGSFSPGSFSPGSFSPGSFSSAQTRSMIGFSAFEGTSGEGIYLNTWNNNGDLYVRVSGRNGAFDATAPFQVQVWYMPSECDQLTDELPETTLTRVEGDYKTVILTDVDRMCTENGVELCSTEERDALEARLADLAARPEVAGIVVDVGADARVSAANQQADAYYGCPYAKNLVAEAIAGIVDLYRDEDPLQESLEYVVLVGGDEVFPFFRYRDLALLGHESNYVPPVLDHTASQASLRLGYVLGQDAYGARFDISVNGSVLPLPDLAVGRLVETPGEVVGVIDAYLDTLDGVVTPDSALVTGYDFLTDAAEAVQGELAAGMAPEAEIDTLIAPRDLPPLDPASWTADDLGDLVLNNRYDVAYLAGHFSANSALAADYTTSLLTTDLISSTVVMSNSLFFSAGCHSGYNIVAEHAVPGVTLELDWAQAFAQKGATLVAGTGYQYGDTDFIEYSERLYHEFSRQLRTGAGAIPIGKALVAAKQDYLGTTPVMRGIHEKSLLEATIFGLPMLSVNMPGERLAPQVDAPIVTPPLDTYDTNPGAALGLQAADVQIGLNLDLRSIDLKVVDEFGQVTADLVTVNWLDGEDGIVTDPTEPVLPRHLANVTVPGAVARGALWLGGEYEDLPGLTPLTGAPATEIRGVHIPFYSPVFYPIRFWKLNHAYGLADPGQGITQLALTPAQFRSYKADPERGTLREYKSLDFRLYYSTNTETYGGDSTPALADAPTIVRIAAVPFGESPDNGVLFSARVVGNPAAGVQEVWVTYTGVDGSAWRPLQLVQDGNDSTLWQGTLPLHGADPCALRYMVQAVNGLGLVSMETDIGALYSPCAVAPALPTELSLADLPDEPAPYGSQGHFSATLTSGGMSLSGQNVVFTLGSQVRVGVTDAEGQAEVRFPLLSLPATYRVGAAFYGAGEYEASFAEGQIEIVKAETLLALGPDPLVAPPGSDVPLVATLTDEFGRPLNDRKTVFFLVTDGSGSLLPPIPVLTDPSGRAILSRMDLPVGEYSVTTYFNGLVPGLGYLLEDPRYEPSISNAVALNINTPPDCSGAAANPTTIWPPDKEFWPVSIEGVVDPDGDALTIAVDLIFQDEKVGRTKPDGYVDEIDPGTVWVRSERDGNGNGRVYTVRFTATDEHGDTCQGQVRAGIVTHDQSGDLDLLDSGPPWYDSLTGERID